MRQRDKKRNPHSSRQAKRSGDQGKWRELAAAHRAKGRVQQNGLLHSVCLRFGLTTARPHGPWWCRRLGIASEDRQGKAAGTCLRRGTRYRAADPECCWYGRGSPPPGSQPGWDETKAAVAGCKRSNRSRRTKHFLLLRVPGRACPPWHRGTVAPRQEGGRSVGRALAPAGET